MAYASVTYTSASGTTFALTNSNGDPIPYIRKSDIKVYVNTVLQTLTTDYTFNSAGTAIVLNSAVSGATVLLQRITDITDPTVVYTAGSTLTAQDLNNADNQIRYGLQEFQDSVQAGGGVPDGDKGDIVVGGGGTIWSIDAGAVTEGKIASGAVTSTKIANDTIVNADINSAAAIAYSKLNLAGSVVDADISASAEIAVSKLADGSARQLLQTDAAGTGVEWTNNVDVPGTLDVTGAATFDSTLTVAGDVTVPSLNGGPLAGTRNLLINGNPIINQRGYVSGAATTGANQYTLDRWRVVTSGQSITWTDSNNVRTVTAPAGGVEQIVEGINVLSGTYTLNWTGTATATVDGNSVSKGGSVTLTGGTNCTVRFSNGTFALAQLEPGTIATPFERRSYGQELLLCYRYYQVIQGFRAASFETFLSYFGGTLAVSPDTSFIVPMRAAPTGSITNASVQYYSYASAWTNTTLTLSITNDSTYYLSCASDGDGRGKLMRNGSSGTAPNPVLLFTAEL